MRIEIMNIKHIASGKCGYYILISCYLKNIIIAVLLPYALCIIWFYGKLTLSLDFLLLSNYIYHSMRRAIFQNYKPNLIHQPKNPQVALNLFRENYCDICPCNVYHILSLSTLTILNWSCLHNYLYLQMYLHTLYL